jgi:hypothetical protein
MKENSALISMISNFLLLAALILFQVFIEEELVR